MTGTTSSLDPSPKNWLKIYDPFHVLPSGEKKKPAMPPSKPEPSPQPLPFAAEEEAKKKVRKRARHTGRESTILANRMMADRDTILKTKLG